MQPWLVVAALVVFLASRPIEARLWLTGRLSDRTTTLLVLGRMPALVLVACVFEGAPLILTIGLVAVASLVPALSYRFFMNLLAEQRGEREKEAARAAKT
jgi:hypothetical protein